MFCISEVRLHMLVNTEHRFAHESENSLVPVHCGTPPTATNLLTAFAPTHKNPGTYSTLILTNRRIFKQISGWYKCAYFVPKSHTIPLILYDEFHVEPGVMYYALRKDFAIYQIDFAARVLL